MHVDKNCSPIAKCSLKIYIASIKNHHTANQMLTVLQNFQLANTLQTCGDVQELYQNSQCCEGENTDPLPTSRKLVGDCYMSVPFAAEYDKLQVMYEVSDAVDELQGFKWGSLIERRMPKTDPCVLKQTWDLMEETYVSVKPSIDALLQNYEQLFPTEKSAVLNMQEFGLLGPSVYGDQAKSADPRYLAGLRHHFNSLRGLGGQLGLTRFMPGATFRTQQDYDNVHLFIGSDVNYTRD